MKGQLFLLLLCASISIQAQRMVFPDKKIIEVPFVLTNDNKLITKVLVNGIERNFQLDTGASQFMVSTALNLPSADSSRVVVHQGTHPFETYRIWLDSLYFQGIHTERRKILVSEMEDGIDGLIGYDFLKKYDLYFNLKKRRLLLIRPEETERFLNNQKKSKSVSTLVMVDHLPVVECVIGKDTLQMGIDCGATTHFLKQSVEKRLRKRFRHKVEAELSGVNGQTEEVTAVKIRKIKVGKCKYRKQMTIIAPSEIFNELGIDGLLGVPFLAKRPVLISYQSGRLILF